MGRNALLILALLLATAPLGAQTLMQRSVAGNAVDIRVPSGAITADVLVLPGWNFDKRLWGDKTELYRIADSLGWRLVLPQMLRSIYASRFYAETAAGYRSSPTLPWLTDTLLPQLQGLGLFDPHATNYLVGLSTGARGVLRVAWATDTLFAAGFAVSGDYDHADTTDRLLIQSYGRYSQQRARWALDEPIRGAATVRVPLYIAHAQDDRITPHRHSIALGIVLSEGANAGRSTVVISPTGGHDWPYWDAALRRALPWLVQRRR